jgi:deoxyadenosine/deoxycytidine kinase
MSSAEIPRYIVIEGPIGVGKTSLAKRIAADFKGELLLEGAEENPFLERFYRNPRHAALPTQLFFLFQRAQQIQELRQSDMFAPVRVADFILEKDRLFAQLTLDDHELKLYEQVYDNITVDAPQPDLVIYLQAPVDVLLTRVQKRGRDYERFIETNYLERLVEAYTRFFYHYTATPLLIVNAADIDLVSKDQDYQLLLERISKATSGRHYFNPGSFDL